MQNLSLKDSRQPDYKLRNRYRDVSPCKSVCHSSASYDSMLKHFIRINSLQTIINFVESCTAVCIGRVQLKVSVAICMS